MQKIEYSLSSLEVAEMLETEHWKLLRKLEGDKKSKGIVTVLTDNNFVVSDFFIPSTYKDSSGKENKCYKVTKKGCEFLANKFTGEKGVLFTACYINRFHEMENALEKFKITIDFWIHIIYDLCVSKRKEVVSVTKNGKTYK